jgi:hypothetical protein
MTDYRQPTRLIEPRWVREGAGVLLRRSIAGPDLDYLDPFLLFDHFGSDNPADYLAGFPQHPHRGIETVTYMLHGTVRHADSLGNRGEIGPGDVQWMTAGGGILHEEMPRPLEGRMEGFQLWVNLPARLKLSAPRYQEIPAAQIPAVAAAPGALVRIVAGELAGVEGPVREIAAEPTYLDVSLAPGSALELPAPADQATFAYLFRGQGWLGGSQIGPDPLLAVLGEGDAVLARAGDEGMRFLLVAGRPLGEPIARYGPFVMNTPAEIQQALQDLRNGTFVYGSKE